MLPCSLDPAVGVVQHAQHALTVEDIELIVVLDNLDEGSVPHRASVTVVHMNTV